MLIFYCFTIIGLIGAAPQRIYGLLQKFIIYLFIVMYSPHFMVKHKNHYTLALLLLMCGEKAALASVLMTHGIYLA